MSLKLQKKPVEVEFRPEGYAVLESHHEEAFFMDWRRDPFPKILMFIGGEGILEMRGFPASDTISQRLRNSQREKAPDCGLPGNLFRFTAFVFIRRNIRVRL